VYFLESTVFQTSERSPVADRATRSHEARAANGRYSSAPQLSPALRVLPGLK